MKLTSEEKELVLKHREQNALNKPQKVGYLKMDLFSYDTDFGSGGNGLAFYRESDNGLWLCDKEVMKTWVRQFKEHFKLEIPKGIKFVCFIDKDGKESWFDDENYGMEDRSRGWAETFLEKIYEL
jgi:hypothetical protein